MSHLSTLRAKAASFYTEYPFKTAYECSLYLETMKNRPDDYSWLNEALTAAVIAKEDQRLDKKDIKEAVEWVGSLMCQDVLNNVSLSYRWRLIKEHLSEKVPKKNLQEVILEAYGGYAMERRKAAEEAGVPDTWNETLYDHLEDLDEIRLYHRPADIDLEAIKHLPVIWEGTGPAPLGATRIDLVLGDRTELKIYTKSMEYEHD